MLTEPNMKLLLWHHWYIYFSLPPWRYQQFLCCPLYYFYCTLENCMAILFTSCIPTWYLTLRLERCIHIWRDWGSLSSNTGPCASFCLLLFKSKIFSILSSGQLRTLIVEAKSRGLKFVYALSPGQDIVFSSSCDLTLLKRKLRQVDDTGKMMTSAGTWFYDLSLCFFFSLIHNLTSLSRCPIWAARLLPFCLMTSITPCVRLTARPFRHSPTLRSL